MTSSYKLFRAWTLWQLAFVIVANGWMLFASIEASFTTSPSFDEPAHFASGVILVRKADAGYFKVNPPANKWITAGSSFIAPALEMPSAAASSSFANSMRPEFDLGDKLLELNPDKSYFNALVIARLARVPFLLLGSWMLWQLTAMWPMTRRALCQVFWCTSPLLLGHGVIVSADALSGVAMCFILWTTILLWKNPNWFGFALSGLAWGLAIGTKFTFGPLYVAFPLGIADFVTHYNDDRLHNAIGYKTRNEVFSEAKNQNMLQLRLSATEKTFQNRCRCVQSLSHLTIPILRLVARLIYRDT